MPNFCAAPNCTRKSTQSDLAFFRFPRDPERCRIWVENCRRADLEAKTSDQLNKHYRLCAKHFDPAMVIYWKMIPRLLLFVSPRSGVFC
uniref:THAP domain containing 12b n=1 Tax=Gasterosteus aculeatus aculeatus TaxID=481459 RepID=A0AAQ4QI74_GASAC